MANGLYAISSVRFKCCKIVYGLSLQSNCSVGAVYDSSDYIGQGYPQGGGCQVFENVNTGGVSLTVFELVTAIFAMDNFELRKDWEERQKKYFSDDILSVTSATDFLTACTLLSSYKKAGP